MSGRDHEPVAAFFPSIDRNLMRDLDRQLRNKAPEDVAPHADATEIEATGFDATGLDATGLDATGLEASYATEEMPVAGETPRPSTSDILEAVEQAAASMAAMGTRIQELEAAQAHLEATNAQLKGKLGELLHNQLATEAAARADSERAARAEQIAAQYMSRAQVLEHDLETALGDLNKIAEAITGTLGT